MHKAHKTMAPFVVFLTALVVAAAEGPVGGCLNQSLWTPVLAEYLDLPIAARHQRLAEFYAFCVSVENATPFDLPELRSAWDNYTVFLPLEYCFKNSTEAGGITQEYCIKNSFELGGGVWLVIGFYAGILSFIVVVLVIKSGVII